MKIRFDPNANVIRVQMELVGPTGQVTAQMALDTGATSTLVNSRVLIAIGYTLASASGYVRIVSSSGEAYVPRVTVAQIKALEQTHDDFPILVHTLPPDTDVDGLLGLDFLRGRILNLDFVNGELELS